MSYLTVHCALKKASSVSSGMSRSLESVLSGPRPRAHTVGVVRVDQQGRLMPPVLAAHSVVMQQDPRRFSEASIVPPPRPPLPNLKRLNMKVQRRPAVQPAPGTSWPLQMVLSPPAQTQPQQQPQQGNGGSNLPKMAHMANSTPQLDEYTDTRERERERIREREKILYVQNMRDSLTAQVRDSFIIALWMKTCSMDSNTSFVALLLSGDGGSTWSDH